MKSDLAFFGGNPLPISFVFVYSTQHCIVLIMVEVRLTREHGEGIAVEMEESETVDNLKQKVNCQHSIPVHCQRIKQRGSLVANSETIQSLKQEDTSVVTLQLDVRYVLTIDVYNGSSFELEVSSHELVDSLMSAICRHSRVSFYRQEIRYDECVLESGRRISEYGVPDGAILVVGLRNYRAMVFVKTLHGRTIVLHVHAHDTVDEVKQLIEQQEGILAHKQRLIFVGEQLRGDQRFLDYNIEHESAVHLVLREGSGFEVYVDTPGGKNYVIEVHPNDSLDQLNEKLNSKVNIPIDMQRVYLGEKLLSDSCSLRESGVGSQCTLRLALAEDCAMINMTVSARTSFPMWVRLDQTVQSLKDVVAEHERTNSRYVQLHCSQTVMEGTHPLRHYRIRHNQTIRVSILRPVLMRLRVTVRGSPATPLDLHEPVNSTILNIKETLAQRFHGRVQDMQLFMDGSELQDGRTLHDSGVLDHSNLDLIHSPSGSSAAVGVPKSMHLFVKTLTGKTVMVDVDPTDTILAIKEQIHAKEGVAIPRQCLVIGGRIMDDSVRLAECGIQNQSVLHLVLRVPSQGPINVTVEQADHTFQLPLMHGDTVGYLKEQVETRTGISRHNMNLLVEGQVLEEDSNSLADYDVDDGTVIQVQPVD